MLSLEGLSPKPPPLDGTDSGGEDSLLRLLGLSRQASPVKDCLFVLSCVLDGSRASRFLRILLSIDQTREVRVVG